MAQPARDIEAIDFMRTPEETQQPEGMRRDNVSYDDSEPMIKCGSVSLTVEEKTAWISD
jgi:hypothetical protein